MNLIINARDAMPAGGVLTITTRRVQCSTRRVAAAGCSGAAPGEYAAITVADTGVGMPPETVGRIFDPFFTTKGDGGTGLGLATVYGIVEQAHGRHRGALDRRRRARRSPCTCRSPPRPSRRGDPALAAGRPAARLERGDRILVVEDEPRVRELVTTILDGAGHAVHVAATAEQALDQLDGGLAIDVLLTDVGLPSQSGIELAAQVTRRLPDVAVVYMSGYADKPIPRDAKLDREAVCRNRSARDDRHRRSRHAPRGRRRRSRPTRRNVSGTRRRLDSRHRCEREPEPAPEPVFGRLRL